MRTDSRPAPDFPDEAPGLLFGVKDSHFWFTHRRLAIREAARDCLADKSRARILDLGCGDGEILAELSRATYAVGLDPRINDLALASPLGETSLPSRGLSTWSASSTSSNTSRTMLACCAAPPHWLLPEASSC